MTKKRTNDEYDDTARNKDSFGFPGEEDDGLTEEEREFSFDEDYIDGPGTHSMEEAFFGIEEDEAAGEDRSIAAALKKLAGRDKNTGLIIERKKRDRRRKKPGAYDEKAPVTVGLDLRNDEMLVYDSELDEVDYTDPEDLPELRDYMPIRFRRYGRSGVAGGILYALFIISASIILACMAWMFASDVLALNKESNTAVVTIEKYVPEEGEPTTTVVNDKERPIKVDIDQVATALKNAGVIQYKWLFKLFSRVSHANTKIDPGTYDVGTELDYRAIVSVLQFGSGKQQVTQITFPEGFNMEQIFTLLEENQICEKWELYEAAANEPFDKYEFLADIPLGDASRLEGFLFPDTYEFYQNEAPKVSINRFLQNFNNKLSDGIKTSAADRGLSIQELVTVASLIEKEAGSTEERPIMASIIYNRLNSGWKLQLDSTLNYIKGTSTFALTNADMEIDSPYNTYLYEGLPIGPICSPGLESIEAAAWPDSTDYWYWYSVDGQSYFFTDYEDFNAFAEAHPY